MVVQKSILCFLQDRSSPLLSHSRLPGTTETSQEEGSFQHSFKQLSLYWASNCAVPSEKGSYYLWTLFLSFLFVKSLSCSFWRFTILLQFYFLLLIPFQFSWIRKSRRQQYCGETLEYSPFSATSIGTSVFFTVKHENIHLASDLIRLMRWLKNMKWVSPWVLASVSFS